MSQSPTASVPSVSGAGPVDPHTQAQQQSGQRQVRLSFDERSLTTIYCNFCRTNTSAPEEIVLDFGMSLMVPSQQAAQPAAAGKDQVVADMVCTINDRVVMNYFTAKRLAIMLSQAVRAHEERFGELKLNAADRVVKK